MATAPSFDYRSLLGKAKRELPEPTSSGERWETPQADVMAEGRSTVIRNWTEIVERVRRDPQHLLKYLLSEFGTAGDIEGDRVLFQGSLPTKAIQERLDAYVRTYVTCSECGRPDTHLDRQERTTLLKCEACGAHKPIVVRKARAPVVEKPTIKEGQVYDLTVEDVSQRGDGVAKMYGFTIFVPGGKRGGQHKVLIEKISGSVAFGRIQP
jgi:translation initiation factor 2 subunit 2